MICDECQQRAVTVHITRVVNNHKTQLNLCDECAKKYQKQFSFGAGFEQDFSIHKFLAGLLDEDLGEKIPYETGLEIKCEKCGLTYADFSQHGRLGCGRCYDTFKAKMDPLLERIHGSSVHTGKVPGKTLSRHRDREQHDDRFMELNRLRKELQSLVEQELFEEAATVRDRIRELEASQGSTS